MTISAEASAQVKSKDIEFKEGLVFGVFDDASTLGGPCWEKTSDAKKLKLLKGGDCVATVSLPLVTPGVAVFRRAGDVTTVDLGDGSSGLQRFTVRSALTEDGYAKLDEVSSLVQAAKDKKLTLFVLDKQNNTRIAQPKTGLLAPYIVRADGILVASDDPAVKAENCWTRDASEPDKYRPNHVGCVVLDRIEEERMLKPDAQQVTYDLLGSFLTVKLKGDTNDLIVQWALGAKGPVPIEILKSTNLTDLKGDYLLVVKDANEALKVVKANGFVREKPPEEPVGAWNEAHCDPARVPDSDTAYVCVDTVGGLRIIRAPRRSLLQPNQSLTVLVRHRKGEKVTLALSGDRGITIPKLSEPTPDRGIMTAVPTAPQEDPRVAFAIAQFSPRRAGSLDLNIKSDPGGGADPTEYKIELEVDQLFWGAVRFGLGTIFDVSESFHGYDVKTFAGSQTGQLRAAHIPVQFELVTGFAFYPEFLWGNGRSYVQKDWCSNFRFAPFVGFGVVGQSAKEISALTSFHIGIEAEITRDFSIAATVAWKQTRVLSAGYQPGSPVALGTSADDFSTTTFLPGFGVVLNASPSFLQFATGDKKDGK